MSPATLPLYDAPDKLMLVCMASRPGERAARKMKEAGTIMTTDWRSRAGTDLHLPEEDRHPAAAAWW